LLDGRHAAGLSGTHDLIRMSTQSSKTVSLVLGSGGARGLAHIGAIQWLREHGHVIRSISGSSMGALVGGIYAANRLDLYTEWVIALQRMGVVRLLDPAFGRSGLLKGERIIGVLRELIGDCRIEDLPVSYTAVATDLVTGEEVWLRNGSLFDAIRASMSTPLVFTPFNYRGRELLDGGLVNPVPVGATLTDDTDVTVAVNLSGPMEVRASPPPESPKSERHRYQNRIRSFVENLNRSRGRTVAAAPTRGAFDIAFASMEAMQSTITRLRLATCAPDVMVEIPRNACGFHEFWRAEEMIALGRERTARAFAKISCS
jgi:NTE family protein